jgi:hypothetical protein
MPLPRLNGEQHHAAYLAATGHHVIRGTAGSGKTVMAILRAGHTQPRPRAPAHPPQLAGQLSAASRRW